eukprot:TRINITY_DN11346_c0_g2_i5.p1 TRINITY_DN11346_c0_g2~~TRINITY_DN11346_c0_g2_i5.p1  ORF type:complete len:197 (+),score=32.59 TRINITY_DN11346_c0_g2_i5:163-753(+)
MEVKESEEQNNWGRERYSPSVVWDDMATPCKHTFQSLYYSTKCKYVYVVILLLTLVLGVWSIYELIAHKFPPPAFYVLELTVNAIFIADISLRVWLNGCRRFWSSVPNIFEVILIVICTVTSIVIICHIGKRGNDSVSEVFDSVVMLILCLFQFLRIGFIANRQVRQAIKDEQKIEVEESQKRFMDGSDEKVITVP